MRKRVDTNNRKYKLELEKFNLNLVGQYKSKKFKDLADKNPGVQSAVISPAMKIKLADEQCYLRELVKARIACQREMEKNLGKNSRLYKNTIALLRQEARKRKVEVTTKFKNKDRHLKEKYNKCGRQESDRVIPDDLQEYSDLIIFNKNGYESLEPVSYEVKTIGQVELTQEEKSVLKLHPKFCIIDKLSRQEFEQEQEAALAKLRMEINKEEENKDLTNEEIIENQEIDAKGRQVFDPVEKIYDSRRRRVTDLKECSRIPLPRPLSTDQEATLELRKRTQLEVFSEYMTKYTDKNGRQESNLTQEEEAGLKSLQKKISKGQVIIIKTDKSSKFAATQEEEYKKMGEVHTRKDKEISRQELIEIEENLNGHSRAWAQIWSTGDDHNHTSRVMASKVTHSENIADLYLMYKDHKSGDKTRPTATGHSSNSLGMSNAVSEVLEAVANSEPNRYNTISTEDMLSRITEYNKQVQYSNDQYNETRIKKLACTQCKIMEYIDCQNTEEHNWEKILQSTWPPRGSPSPGTCPREQKVQQEIQDLVESLVNNPCCGEQIQAELSTHCEQCGPAISTPEEYTVLGSDVKALYPSITSENTGKIIRRRIENSTLEFEGFCWKRGLAYIDMNKNLTTDIDELENILPTRKSGLTKELKTSAITTSWDPELKYEYKQNSVTEQELRTIIARVTEIATRILFENHVYRFGGQIFKQQEGGSIGDRWTGAASELVMQDWAEKYKAILDRSEVRTILLAGYVDDGRQGTTLLPEGMRFNKNENKFTSSTEAAIEDKKLREQGEAKNQRMARICLEAMNSINPDLEFTVESQEDFKNEKLPTLDFAIWQEEDGIINHTYFQKEMKTPYVVMSKSAMSTQQKVQILSNELTRRMYSIRQDTNPQSEYNAVINQLTQELRTSGYNYTTAREIITSGIRGWKTRINQRIKKGQEIYRPAHKTVRTREKKKLIGRESWYKTVTEHKTEQDPAENNTKPRLRTNNKNNVAKKRQENSESQDKKQEQPTKSVMFVPYTPGSVLAKMLRENENKISQLASNKMKIVERAGIKLQDILTRSNPWKGQDCLRPNCLLCLTKKRTEKNQTQECMKRNLVYETRCLTCENNEYEKIDQMEIQEQEKEKMKRKVKLYKYIGETSRSAYERGWEHVNDMAQLSSRSHMLKHAVGVHPNKDMSEVQFGMRVLKYNTSSFERQIMESVVIQVERQDHNLLNSRTEFNRCSLPRLCTQIGDGEYKQYTKELEFEKLEEQNLETKIRELRKLRNKARMHPTKETGNDKKRRKVDKNEYISIDDIWGHPPPNKPQKNKNENEYNIQNKRTRNLSPRPSRGSPSPGTSPKERQENKPENELESCNQAPKPPRGPTSPGTSPTSTEHPTEPIDWDKELAEHRKELEKNEQEQARIEQEENNKKELSWELHNLCQEYLEENSQDWKKLKEKRNNEKNRILRLEKAGILTRKARINALENNIKVGLEKLTQEQRTKLRQEQERKEEIELRNARKDLWTLRSREKKIVPNETRKRIQELGNTAIRIKEILDQERKKVQEEKEEQARQETERRTRKEKSQQKARKIKQLQEKWAMYRWVNEYIDKNKNYWDNEKKKRDQARQNKLDEWDKNNRFEKIRILREKRNNKNISQNKESEKTENEKNPRWSVWRNNGEQHQTPRKENNTTPETEKKNLENKKKQQEVYPIFTIKLKKPKNITLRANKPPHTQETTTSDNIAQFLRGGGGGCRRIYRKARKK